MNINMQAQVIIVLAFSINLLCHSLRLRLESWNMKQGNASQDSESEAPLSSLLASLILALISITVNVLIIGISIKTH